MNIIELMYNGIFETEKEKQYKIKKVIFNKPATIVFWEDGTKTTVKCTKDDVFDAEKGVAMAVMKKVFGNTSYYLKMIDKFVKENVEVENEKLSKTKSKVIK